MKVTLPTTAKEIDEVEAFHFLEELNENLDNLSSVVLGSLEELKRARSVKGGKAWNWINMSIIRSYGVSRQVREDGRRRRLCPVDQILTLRRNVV